MVIADKKTLTRRTFLRFSARVAAGATAALATGPWIVRAAGRRAEKPNILFIITDEHTHAVTGCYGDDLVRTPNLDALAARGVVFDNCYTNSPLCVPARLSFTAGKYCSRVHAWSNNCWLPSDDYPSIARVLQRAGYETYLGGKMHYDPTRRYGFTELYPAWTNRSFKSGRGGRRKPDDTRVNYRSWKGRSSQFLVADTSRVMEHDLLVTRHCSDFLLKRRPSEKPFFLIAGYLAPHFPLIVPRRFYEPYKDKVPMPEIPEGLLENLPLNYKHLRRGFGLVGADPRVVKKGRELYWGLTQWVDDQIGRLLGALSRSPFADNTVVIYTADHGENKGDHGLWWKNCMFESAAHIPLIISWPERWKPEQRRSGCCSLVDVAQTIADLAGAETPDDWDGDSMLRWLDDPAAKWKDFALSEYYAHNIASGFTMFRRGKWKYVYHARMDKDHGPERELYDVEADPKEFRNLARERSYASLVESLHAAMLKEIGRDPDETEQICRADYAKGYGRKRPGARRKKKAARRV